MLELMGKNIFTILSLKNVFICIKLNMYLGCEVVINKAKKRFYTEMRNGNDSSYNVFFCSKVQ